MVQITHKVIETIRKNRISTSEVSDCLGKTGAIRGITPLNPGHFSVGAVEFVYAYNQSNWELHEQLRNPDPGKIVVVEAINCEDYGVFGSLVSKFLLLYRQVQGIVVNGLVRDAHTLRKENYPIWSKGVTPLGCFNVKNSEPPPKDILNRLHGIYDGSIAVCDDSGVVIIPKEHINEKLIEKLHWIELQEDAWFHGIDTDGFDTYETVCLKRYLDEGSVFNKYERLKPSDS
ncbi:MAG: RraA family protein [Moorea sp. SIOASIH]|uniref:RraA family protein n=1 Tax=Moorena sp. SIOASIH TaxID=2607817 RepID=UPI0013BBC27A|nr:RraA family protein [Moorena sp. SIOASIH]NEO35144.1 RraA family protein [Moorena sp. SIOASIH]